eukprot:MONOS_4858.1-p1 / transcript=MONOS_4858.1 / gene=MONOS_4858 / organism=Monocercomonoides_exilis_PA203 / gene_product=cysteine-rich protein 2 / transcript_product=cysteine-rich protein 2 / location=Mono_scaffold00135:69952-71084(-) / protein_length=226 / sequence_SO=supercontig / SO=protein_coding / is_pseudo=false
MTNHLKPPEWILGLGKHWHRRCLTCKNCQKILITSEIVEHGGEPFCNNCYSKLFGGPGVGRGRTSYADQPAVKAEVDRCGPPVNSSTPNSSSVESSPSTSSSPSSSLSSKPSDSLSPCPKSSSTPSTPPSPAPKPKTSPKPTTLAGLAAGPDKCPTCKKTVYPAEALSALGKKYHRLCFKCVKCGTTLALGRQIEHDNEPYCEKCHNQYFRIAGYGGGANLTSYAD